MENWKIQIKIAENFSNIGKMAGDIKKTKYRTYTKLKKLYFFKKT